jgi:Tfp pilus assembly pilus retraction ATPase PilT
MTIGVYLETPVERGGSDLLLHAQVEQVRAAVTALISEEQLVTLERECQLDLAVTHGDGIRLRANASFQRESISLAMRLLL